MARQQDRKLAELASLRDDVNVLTAIIQRLDTKVIRLLAGAGQVISFLRDEPRRRRSELLV